jgi:hypothetical protein
MGDGTLSVADILDYALFISAMVVLITGPFCSNSETQCPPKGNANRNRFLRRQKIKFPSKGQCQTGINCTAPLFSGHPPRRSRMSSAPFRPLPGS